MYYGFIGTGEGGGGGCEGFRKLKKSTSNMRKGAVDKQAGLSTKDTRIINKKRQAVLVWACEWETLLTLKTDTQTQPILKLNIVVYIDGFS